MKYQEDLHLEATELRLGLPGCRSTNNEADHKQSSSSSSSSSSSLCASRGTKRTSSDLDTSDSISLQSQQHTCPAPPKAQIVGWPPIRSCRKNSIQVIKNGNENTTDGSGVYVKVSMDGAPYLRKIDLNIYKGYTDLLLALGGMFNCNIINIDGSNHQYATTYQDKDGDWMLAGDVPWEMFVSSCKRLRIMRASEPKGLII